MRRENREATIRTERRRKGRGGHPNQLSKEMCGGSACSTSYAFMSLFFIPSFFFLTYGFGETSGCRMGIKALRQRTVGYCFVASYDFPRSVLLVRRRRQRRQHANHFFRRSRSRAAMAGSRPLPPVVVDFRNEASPFASPRPERHFVERRKKK